MATAKGAKPKLQYDISEQLRNRPAPPIQKEQPAPASTRPLRIFTLDPSVSARVGGVATVNVPYEALGKGPAGARFQVEPEGAPELFTKVDLLVDLDQPAMLRNSGVAPTPNDGRFHMQMAYAVCTLTYNSFQRALGREIDWACGVPHPETGLRRLRVRPFLLKEPNAYYDRSMDGLVFGYFPAGRSPAGHTVPKGLVFTGLSHDVLVHETTHALLDALRPEFFTPSHPDVLGFHEGFADIIALLQRFSYPDVVEHAIRESHGSLHHAELLANVAQEFGNALSTTEHPAPLRAAVDLVEFAAFDSDAVVPNARNRRGMLTYKPNMEEHDMGAVLLTAVFEAFVTIFRRRTERYYRIANISPNAVTSTNFSSDLIKLLAAEASEIASRFLDICIRAIDYCPPVDLELGEYLRALITADAEMVANDKWGYREALIRSFRRRRLFPANVHFMSEDAVRWDPCEQLRVPGLAFRDLRFNGDPGNPVEAREMERQIDALGKFISDPENARKLNLYLPGTTRRFKDLTKPTIQSIRCARRVAPDGRVMFDTIAEIIQTCTVTDGRLRFQFSGGCTVVIDTYGYVRYVIHKKLDSESRRERQAWAIRGPLADYWAKDGSVHIPAAGIVQKMHSTTGREGRKGR